jgi:hypothetical protein
MRLSASQQRELQPRKAVRKWCPDLLYRIEKDAYGVFFLFPRFRLPVITYRMSLGTAKTAGSTRF